jgi:hypothetical protein
MNKNQTQSMTEEVEAALLREMWHLDGKVDAFRFVWDCGGVLSQIRSKVQEVEEQIHEPPSALKDRMSHGASTRMYQDGYLEGLKEAIDIISAASIEKQKQAV